MTELQILSVSPRAPTARDTHQILSQCTPQSRDRQKSCPCPCPAPEETGHVLSTEDQNLPFTLSIQFSWFRNSWNWQAKLLHHHVTGLYSAITESHSVTTLLDIITDTKNDMSFREKKKKHFCSVPDPSKEMYLFLMLSLSEKFSFGNVWIIDR